MISGLVVAAASSEGSNMSAWVIRTTARLLRRSASAKVSRIWARTAPVRYSTSATCSGVAVVSPKPVHGCSELLLPWTFSTEKATRFCSNLTFSGSPRFSWVFTGIVAPNVFPGSLKNTSRTRSRRSSGL